MNSIKAIAIKNGLLHVLGAPFGGPINGKDIHGQYFSQKTNFLSDLLPAPPVFYFHGAMTKSISQPIAQTLRRWVGDDGIWFEVKLNLDDPVKEIADKAKELWEAAKAGKLFASSGAVPPSIVIDKETGHIEQWLIGELSLIDLDPSQGRLPANFYAIAVPNDEIMAKMATNEEVIIKRSNISFDKVNVDYPEMETDDIGDAKDEIEEEIFDGVRQMVMSLFEGIFNDFMVRMSDNGNKPFTPNSVKQALNTSIKTVFEDENLEIGVLEMSQELNQKQNGSDVTAATPETPSTTPVATTSTVPTDRELALEREMLGLKADNAAQKHTIFINKCIASGKVTPGEREDLITFFSKCFMADVQLGENGDLVDSLMAVIEGRPENTVKTAAIPNGDLTIMPGNAGVSPDQANELNAEYLARMRRYQGIPENSV